MKKFTKSVLAFTCAGFICIAGPRLGNDPSFTFCPTAPQRADELCASGFHLRPRYLLHLVRCGAGGNGGLRSGRARSCGVRCAGRGERGRLHLPGLCSQFQGGSVSRRLG